MTGLTLNRLDFDGFKLPGMELPELSLDDDEDIPEVYISDKQKREKFIHDIAITGISGDEGDGKSLLMTRLAYKYHKMGGEILTFPGYELIDNGTVVSKELSLEAWAKLDPKVLTGKLVCIDEIQDFFDAQMWQTILVKIATGVFGQRRHTQAGIIYTLQYFNELPRLMRAKTRFVIQCKDAARFNDVREYQEVEGRKTYTTILDNQGRKNLHIRGMVYRGPTYHNQPHWEHYSTHKNPDIMSKFTRIDLKRKVISVDLNGDGEITEDETKATQKLFDQAKVDLVNAFEKNKNRLNGSEYWNAAHLNPQNSAHQKIAAQLNELLGINKQYRSYIRDYDLVNT